MINCCYCDPRVDYQFIGDIAGYIGDEMQDSRYYALLAQQAPTQRAKDLLNEFSADEWAHSQSLMRAYNMLTGKVYSPPAVTDPAVPEYNEALKQRVIAETNDYRKYGEKYLAACNACLKEMFYNLRTGEAIHAMRMQILFAGG
jgi:rubrerythrin